MVNHAAMACCNKILQ